MSKRNWYMRAIHLVVALAFLLGLAIMPGLVTAQEWTGPVPGINPPDIAFNVKGSIHKVCIDWDPDLLKEAQIDWWLEAGVDLNPADVTVIAPSGDNPNGGVYGETIKTKDTIDNVPCVELRSMKRGDIHIYVKITLRGEYVWTLHTEKKWGELEHTELDVDASTGAVDHTHSEDFDGDETGEYQETLQDTVWATFLSFPGDELVDGAIVHWWLVEDDATNQAWVDAFMDYLAAHEGGLDDDHWAAHGKYRMSDLGGREPWEYINDWVIGDIDPDGDGAEYVDTNLFYWDAVDVPGEIDTHPDTGDWYAWAVTEGGIATATLGVDLDNLEPCHTYNTMVVVLVSYPGGSTPQDDPFNGENIVCLEKGKKSFHKGTTPEIEQVKTPQLRWAGEKIVLEKEWPYEPSFTIVEYADGVSGLAMDLKLYAAVYSLEEGSIGNLEPISDVAGITISTPGFSGTVIELGYLGLPVGAQQVIAPLGGYYLHFSDDGEYEEWGGYTDTQAILVSEQSGQADVNVALYEVHVIIGIVSMEQGILGEGIGASFNGPIMNHGFLVYFLEFEDVTLAEDITPWDSLTGLEPEEEDGYVAVQVRGFFDYRFSHLMATTREAKAIDLTGDGVVDVWLPAGRYVLPDDWPLLAGTTNTDLRPNFDLMDQADLDTIVSPVDTNLDHDEELGPYDSEVRTTDPPAEAEYPTIGPFSTYQLWSTEDMWITEATVPSSIGPNDEGERNTVVPDGEINWYDAPMPQALVLFDIVDYSTTLGELPSLSELDKGDLEGYGFAWSGDDKIYQSPYYAVEIPANWQIPVGYNWRSWQRDPSFLSWYIVDQGPYDFWTDLELESVISNTHEDPIDPWDVEVYSDNHGIAGVTVDALDNLGLVTITATAEYPYLLRGKYGPRVSDDIPVIWGPAFVHLDADFEADPREGDAPLTVDFDPVPWTIGGTAPYTDLHWDFGDGSTEDVSGSWTLATLPSTTHTYTTDGVYTVSLTVTDSTPSPIGPMVDICEKVAYITVGAGVFTITWELEWGLDADPAAVNIWTYAGVPVTLADVDDTMPDGLLIWYYGGPSVGWKFYKQGWGASNTLTTLVPGGVFGIVPTASVWEIPQD
jgi:PKD repeat protein